MESNSSDVELGKLIDENSYAHEKKNMMINETICVDFMGKYNILHEVKKSPSIEAAGEWQLKYYMYYLKQHGVEISKGVIDYPKLRQKHEVFLTEEDERKIEEIIQEIEKIKESKIPEVINSKICKKCAYYELCYI